jgi:hypothetical protein
MICEMTILPSGRSRNHVRRHRVSLLPISYTHDAKRIPSPTSGTCSTLAPQISDCGWLMHRSDKTSEPNSSHHERP